MTNVFKILLLIMITFSASCSTKEEISKAEDALDAVRLFKDAYQNGNYEKAVFYCTKDEASTKKLNTIFNNYKQLSNQEKTQLKSAPIIILNNKEIDENHVQIIISNQPKANNDTFNVVKENESWLVKLSN